VTLDIIEQRAKALGWPISHRSNAFDGQLLRVETPSGYVSYGTDADGEVGIFDRETSISPCRHDLAALESPEQPSTQTGEVDGLREAMRRICEIAHHQSTGPGRPDDLWRIREITVEHI